MKRITVLCLVLVSTILYTSKSTSAGNSIAQCNEIARRTNLPIEICAGELSQGIEGRIRKLSQQKPDQSKLNHLAIYLRQLGYLQSAKAILNLLIQQDPSNVELKLSAANITRAEYTSLVAGADNGFDDDARYTVNTTGLDLASKTLNQYSSLIGNLQSPIEIKATLNWIRFWVGLNGKFPEIAELKKSRQALFEKLVYSVNDRISKNYSENEIEFGLSLAESLTKIEGLSPDLNAIVVNLAQRLLQYTNPNIYPRSFARILAIQGILFKRQGDVDKAFDNFSKARSAALAIGSSELAYQWEVELGRLSLDRGDQSRAKKFYQAAVNHINELRDARLSLTQDIQYQFADSTDIFYREYQNLLFSESKPDYQQIISLYEQQRIAEIENYLNCGKLDTVSLMSLPKEQQPDSTLYLIAKKDAYELLIRLKDGSIHHRSIDAITLESTLTEIRKYLTDNLKEVPSRKLKSVFGKLYSTTLGTLADVLPQEGQIVWVLSSKFQNIPWGALYSNDKYLIEKYSISYSFGSVIRQLSTTRSTKESIIAGGVSESRFNRSPLPGVKLEVEGISKVFPKTKILLNSGFSSEALIEKTTDSSIVHFASHGQFSSDPTKTYILAWDGKINLNIMEKIVQQRTKPIDLLFLSACESAKGDDRSTLGISGTVVRGGAKSAIATLWAVDDESISKMAIDFYKALKSGKNKSEALREAQLIALRSENHKFSNFANWSALLLIGSWR
jgi:CHAT domain-containing protein